jgi:hypothetical protein
MNAPAPTPLLRRPLPLIAAALLTSRAQTVRVQGKEREDMGVMPTDEARQIAMEEMVDLVMISPDASPPLCRLVSFSKFKFESERATKQKQKASKGCAGGAARRPRGDEAAAAAGGRGVERQRRRGAC